MSLFSQSNRAKLAWGGLFLGAVILLSANVFSGVAFKGMRFDLTADKIYTLSPATHAVLSEIDEPVRVRLYFSSALGEISPPHQTYERRVREYLEQYVDLSGGMVQLEVLDPEPFSDIEDRAVAFGLQGIPINSAGDLGYLGIAATNSTDDEQVIPFLDLQREDFLEYDLTKLVYTLSKPEKKVVGLISSLPIMGGRMDPRAQQMPPWTVTTQIGEFFDVRDLGSSFTAIDDDVDMLMIVHPRNLPQTALYAIDQFMLGGGKALVFVDPSAETEGLYLPEQVRGPSDFNRLLEAWGVRLAEGTVAGDLNGARRVNVTNEQGQPLVTDFVVWLTLQRDNLDTTDVVNSDIQRLNVATPGVLETVDGAADRVSPILQTSTQSMRIAKAEIGLPPDAIGLLRNFKPSGERMTLAARISGPAKTAFPDGPPTDPKAETEKAEGSDAEPAEAEADAKAAAPETPAPVTEGTVNAVVIADADMLYDEFWLSVRQFMGQQVQIPTANNVDLVINALDNLSGSAGLIGLRGQGIESRPFTLVDEIQREAERQYRDKEQALLAELEKLQADLKAVEGQDAQGEVLLSAADREKVVQFRQKMINVRQELREVKHALRSDIDSLDAWLKFINIAAIPVLLGLLSIGLALSRRLRRRNKGAAQ